jgi:hypothetical protein
MFSMGAMDTWRPLSLCGCLGKLCFFSWTAGHLYLGNGGVAVAGLYAFDEMSHSPGCRQISPLSLNGCRLHIRSRSSIIYGCTMVLYVGVCVENGKLLVLA